MEYLHNLILKSGQEFAENYSRLNHLVLLRIMRFKQNLLTLINAVSTVSVGKINEDAIKNFFLLTAISATITNTQLDMCFVQCTLY